MQQNKIEILYPTIDDYLNELYTEVQDNPTFKTE